MNCQIKRTEAEEQEAVMEWAEYTAGFYPDLELLHHIPNGGQRNKAEAARLKRQGVKKGVPDLFLPAPRGQYHGLYIEMKIDGGRQSAEQKEWQKRLIANGYLCEVCFGTEKAIKLIEWYLNLEDDAIRKNNKY